MNKPSIPPLDEFIDLGQRRENSRAEHGFQPMQGAVTVAIYDTSRNCQALTIRISEDLAKQHGLVVGARMSCHVHPDQQHIALKPADRRGAALFRPKEGRALVYQTNIKGGTLEPQKASHAVMRKLDDAYVISITP